MILNNLHAEVRGVATASAVGGAVAELRAFLTGDMDTFYRLHDAQGAENSYA